MSLWRWLSSRLWPNHMSERWLKTFDQQTSRVEFDGVCITFPIQKDA